MKLPISDKLNFIKYSLNKNLGPLLIGLTFIAIGALLVYIAYRANGNTFLYCFGGFFIAFSSLFLLYTMPSSIMYYYEQALTKKYGSYTTAKVIKKRMDDYSHTTSSFNSGHSKMVKTFLYVIEFEFNYNNITYTSECFFNEKSTYNLIPLGFELPIKFLRNNPKNVTLRRRKLSNELGISENECQ